MYTMSSTWCFKEYSPLNVPLLLKLILKYVIMAQVLAEKEQLCLLYIYLSFVCVC